MNNTIYNSCAKEMDAIVVDLNQLCIDPVSQVAITTFSRCHIGGTLSGDNDLAAKHITADPKRVDQFTKLTTRVNELRPQLCLKNSDRVLYFQLLGLWQTSKDFLALNKLIAPEKKDEQKRESESKESQDSKAANSSKTTDV